MRAHAQPDDRAVALQAELGVVHLRAPVPHREHVLGAGLGPLHRAVEHLRGLGDEEELDVHALLRPEAAADRGAARRGRVAGSSPSTGATASRTPCGPCDETHSVIPPSGSPGNGDHAVRLHRHRGEPLVHDPLRDDDVGVVEHAVDRPGTHRVGDVRTVLLVQQRRVGRERGFHVGDRRERVVVDDHGSRPRPSPAPSTRRRPSRRCRRRTAPCRARAAAGSSSAAASRSRDGRRGRGRPLAYTATTPGIALASSVSIASILACAIVERTNATCSSPSMSRSSRYSRLTGEDAGVLPADHRVPENRTGRRHVSSCNGLRPAP